MSIGATGNTNPGALDRRVRLDFKTIARDAMGGEVVTWIEGADAWARKVPVNAGKTISASAKHYKADFTYQIRHRDDVQTGWRLVHGDDVFEIVAIEELGRQHRLELTVEAVDQSAHTADAVLLMHDASPFLLHSGAPLYLHREQDAA